MPCIKVLLASFFILALSVNVVNPQEVQFGPWQVSLDGGQTFQGVSVPGTIEDQIDVNFDGVSIYRTSISPAQLDGGQRLLIRFAGAATLARVYLGDKKLGEHLGAWTPFTFDATEAAKQLPNDQPWPLTVEVDEKVGHNTQGFLPIVTHHFGGLWQPVKAWLTESPQFLIADAAHIQWLESDRIQVAIPFSSLPEADFNGRISIREKPLVRGRSSQDWQTAQIISAKILPNDGEVPWVIGSQESGYVERVFSADVQLPFEAERWSPNHPKLYEIAVELLDTNPGKSGVGASRTAVAGRVLDNVIVNSGWCTIVTDGDRFLINGDSIILRGVLNWGYAPPSVAPSLDEAWMRREIEFAQQRGFNMMKFCLWIPPKRYLELCDEMGMLAWIEYPTWHPRLDGKHLEELRREYAEFFQFDRNHPSVVLRSLTCETGPSAELSVIQALYDLCKAYVPGAIVVDDSSWISWNRVYDFFDDHPYGNNHTWVQTLDRLRSYIAERETKPLMLGEAIAADSWTIPTPKMLEFANSSPAHGPWFVADNLRWQESVDALAKRRSRSFDPALLLPLSIRYGMLMRKYQIETYRREVQYGGYVVSVIRDFPKAAMGLIDFEDQPKNTPADWKFQGDTMLLLVTESDRRSFFANDRTESTIHVVTAGDPGTIERGRLHVELQKPGYEPVEIRISQGPQKDDDFRVRYTLDWTLPDVLKPERWLIRATWLTDARHVDQARQAIDERTREVTNEWSIWVFPRMTAASFSGVLVHESARELATLLKIPDDRVTDDYELDQVVLTRRLDSALLGFLERGGKIWMMPDGKEGSLPVSEHWFLRGSLATLRPDAHWMLPFQSDANEASPLETMFSELQHFDLAGPVVPEMDHYLHRTDPLLLLWDNHDRREVKTHGLVFRMGVGESGELLVSTLKLWGDTNSVGHWLANQWNEELRQRSYPTAINRIERMENLALLTAELERQAIPLHQRLWQFRPDPDEVGRAQSWFAVDFDDNAWAQIRADRHWEGQGYADLDYWAWYRIQVEISDEWSSSTTYLNFTGIDDYADIYVNGEIVGAVGDIETRETAFDKRISLDISRFVQAGETIQIAVAVYDWFGAGGIFRPVTLSTEPLSDSPPILR